MCAPKLMNLPSTNLHGFAAGKNLVNCSAEKTADKFQTLSDYALKPSLVGRRDVRGDVRRAVGRRRPPPARRNNNSVKFKSWGNLN